MSEPRNPLLTRIKDTPIRGDPDADGDLLAMCHELIMGDYPMDDRLEGLEIINMVRGVPEGPATVEDVADYVNSFKE